MLWDKQIAQVGGLPKLSNGPRLAVENYKENLASIQRQGAGEKNTL